MRGALAGRTVAMTFSKRSTRTRISTEGAIAAFGGSPMFLGKDDIQLGVWPAYQTRDSHICPLTSR